MAKLFKKLAKSKSILIFSLFIILFLPSTIYLPAESSRRLVVSAVGVDKTNNEIELSVLMVIPKSGGNIGNNYQLISKKGKTLAEALNKMGTAIGKHISFAHCELIIASTNVLEEDLAIYLDFFTRTNNLTSNADLICATNAKEVLEANISVSKEFALNLKDILTNNKKATGIENINVDDFFKNYLSNNNSYIRPYITLEESNNSQTSNTSSSQTGNEGSENMNESSGNQSQNQTKESQSKTLAYDGSFCILKDGVVISIINGDEALGMNMINKHVNKGLIQLKNVTDKHYKNADVTLEILDKKVSQNFQYINGIPYITYDIFLFVKLEEVFSKEFDEESLNTVFDIFGDETLTEAVNTINSSIANLINISKTYDVDIFNVVNQTRAHNFKEYKNYTKSKDKSSLIDNAIIVCNYEFAIRNWFLLNTKRLNQNR